MIIEIVQSEPKQPTTSALPSSIGSICYDTIVDETQLDPVGFWLVGR